MEAYYNVTGAARKELVAAIERLTGEKAKYLGMPSAAYQIGDYKVAKDGTLSWPDLNDADLELLSKRELMMERLCEAGFESMFPGDEQEQGIETEGLELTVTIPLEKVNLENLECLLEAKGELIKKALQIADLKFITDENSISFPWFKEATPEEIAAYTKFISAICEMSVNQKRVTAKPRKDENEKYAFRCFLLRLGFIGDEFKADRKILLQHLDGSSAFKTVEKKGE